MRIGSEVIPCMPGLLVDFAYPKWTRTDSVRIEDVYKWTYQATRGGEHASPSREEVAGRLDREWRELNEKHSSSPLWEPLRPDGEIGRIGLKVYRNAGGQPDDLVEAFLASSRSFRDDPEAFIRAWAEVGERLKRMGSAPLDHREWSRLDCETKAKDYPAVHHSAEYREKHSPSYRIITRAEMAKFAARYGFEAVHRQN